MKKKSEDDFLTPLKNRPGLQPRLEFKEELMVKLRGVEKQKRRIQIIQLPILIGVAAALMFILFSKDIMKMDKPARNNAVQHQEQHNLEDIINWKGLIYSNPQTITADQIGIKYGEIKKRIEVNREDLHDGEATKVKEGTFVYQVGITKDIAVKIDDTWVMYQLELKGDPISGNEAIEIAKVMAPDSEISWTVNALVDNASLEERLGIKLINPVWEVIGTYPLENKEIFYIDAITREILNHKSVETPGFGEKFDDFIVLNEVKDHLDPTSDTYNGQIIVQLSEEAKIELRDNGASVIVTLSGEESSFRAEPLRVPDPTDVINIPFDFDYQSMMGEAKLFVSIVSLTDKVIFEQEMKSLTLE